MNKLTGKVLHGNNRVGLEDLIVLLYDIDFLVSGGGDQTNLPPSNSNLPPFFQELLPAEDGSPEMRFASRLLLRLFATGDDNEDSIWGFTAPPGSRLGSTLTAEDGSFSITYEDSAFQQGSQEQRPETLIMVLAPDQSLSRTLDDGSPITFVGTPEYQRILHLSFYPLRNAARQESVVVKIDDALLQRFNLGTTTATAGDPVRVNSALVQTELYKSELNTVLRDRTRQKISQAKERETRSNRFVSQLSALPKQFRRSPYFFHRGESNTDGLRNTQLRASRDGVDQVSLHTLSPSGRKPQSYLSLDADWLNRIMPDGGSQEVLEQLSAGSSVQAEVDYAAYCAMLYAKNGGVEISRRTESRQQRAARDHVISRLEALRNPPVDTDPDTPPPDADEPPPMPDDLNAEDRIRAIVIEQVAELSVEGPEPDDRDNETDAQQRQRISASLQDLTPPVGPADATAYHDFTSLQIAFPDVWTEAFDGDVEEIVRELRISYEDAYETYREGDSDVLDRLSEFDEEEIYDLKEYTDLLGQLTGDIASVEDTPMPKSVKDLLTQPLEPADNAPTIAGAMGIGQAQSAGIGQEQSAPFGHIVSMALRAAKNTHVSIKYIDQDLLLWNSLSIDQQAELIELAEEYASFPTSIRAAGLDDEFGARAYLNKQFANENPDAEKLTAMAQLMKEANRAGPVENAISYAQRRNEIRARAHAIVASPGGRNTRAQRLMAELAERLKAPHSFRIFAENSYNFGMFTTHRQKWVPGDYQAGDLVSTITLAPGEKRQYVKKEVLKKSRNRKEEEKNASTLNDERAYANKVTGDIIGKISTNTNFAQSVSASASGQLGVFSINGESSTEFGRDQATESERRKQSIRESTRKASQEYKNERSIEISTETSSEFESSFTSEISNPNNEITVTYLFYELERQYRVTEHLQKVAPVIMVAQHVPAPHEIDEDFMMTHEWILRRVILDQSFHEALDYVAQGLVSDEVSLEVLRDNYETQKALVEDLSATVSSLSDMQETLRNSLIHTSEQEKIARVYQKRARKKRRRGIARRIFDPGRMSRRIAGGNANLTFGEFEDPPLLEARREALETRLEYLDANLEAEQENLNSANSALNEASGELTLALQETFTRRNLVTQLKLHIKENILYYMQAIWSHEYSHQRQLRLYNLPIEIPTPGRRPAGGANPRTTITINPIPEHIREGIYRSTLGFTGLATLAGVTLEWPSTGASRAVYHMVSKRLHEVADVDNLLGFKGNYMIFPLKTCTYITDYMMQDYVDEYLGARSPDPLDDLSTDELLDYAEQIWHAEDTTPEQQNALEQLIVERLNSPRTHDEQIVVPTGQLFIEALKGNHALLEHFKLKHREIDVQKAREEVRGVQLENLRKAMRLVREEGALLDDPDVDKKVVVENSDDVDIET